ncbi:MAG TPA: hypothetical protein VMF09_03575 [Solirubrobacteraceae bacterium]|nr:hypothetical protein [Solirubrobacteraceae bacterium]
MRTRAALALAIAASIVLLVGVAGAGAASSIEGIWSFDGGEVGIKPEPNGTFVGIVVKTIRFAECPHDEREVMWTDITPQADGSYWGDHQWFYQGPNCVKNPQPGKTAWRVMEEPSGYKYLRVCFSEPGATQPTIAPDGEAAADTYGCVDSTLIAPLPTSSSSPAGAAGSPATTAGSTPGPGVQGEKETLSLRSAKQCVSVRRFQIHLLEPKHDPFKTVLVRSRGHKIATVRRGDYVVATIDLVGLKRGAFTVTIDATTVLGNHLSGTRTYHTCAEKAKKSKPRSLR